MKVQLRCTLDRGKEGSLPPKSVVDLDRDEAVKLIREKLAIPYDVAKKVDELLPGDERDSLEPQSIEDTIKELTSVSGIDESLAAGLHNEGIFFVKDVASMENTKILSSFEGISKKAAGKIIREAKELCGEIE